MSRFLGGACCAVVALWGLMVFAQQDQPAAADPLAKFEKHTEAANADERIEAALNAQLKAPLDFTELPLNEIISTLSEEYDIPIVFDNAALDEVAISPETEVTVNLRNLTLRSALNLMLKQPGVEDLTYIVDSEVLLITTHERASAILSVQLYRIDDLQLYADPPQENAAGWADFQPIVQVITSCAEPDSWRINGKGEGEIILIRPGILVVSQTRRVHEQIYHLLIQLRDLKAKIESGMPPTLGESLPALAE